MKRRSPREMGKMINVRVRGKEEGEEAGKKCSYLAGGAAAPQEGNEERKRKNTSCNALASTITTPPPGGVVGSGRIISKPRRMDFLSLSPQLLHHHLFETYSYCIGITTKRKKSVKKCCISLPSSSSSSPFTIRSLASSLPILVLVLYIVIMPVSGLANDMLPTASPPTSYVSQPSSTVNSFASSSSTPDELHSGSLEQPGAAVENHHHHPHSSSHLAELPQSDQPSESGGQQGSHGHHKCYVCLPPDKTSRDAEEILSIFSEETRQRIPDCASFGSHNAKHFEFKCPPEYVGCLLRIHGRNESRSCGKLPLNDCKTANSVELCYCTGALCNENRPEILLEETESDERLRVRLEDEKDERETRKIWKKGETDDEDLLGPHQLDLDGMQDDIGDEGSGSEPPPGVIHQYTSTPKPTLVPNIRPESKTTTPKSTSGATPRIGRILSAFAIPFTQVIIPASAIFYSLVPLLLPFALFQCGLRQAFNNL